MAKNNAVYGVPESVDSKDGLLKRFFAYIYKHRAGYLMVAPCIIGVLAFCYYPPIYGMYLAFTDKTASLGSGAFIGVANFVELFNDSEFWGYFWTMAQLQVPRLASGVFTPLVFAEIIFAMTNTKAQGVYRILILLPTVAPGVVNALIWKTIYSADGLMNEIFIACGFVPEGTTIAFLEQVEWVIPAILFQGFPWIGGSAVLIYLSGIMGIPKDFFEAADLDGATQMQKIVKIHLYLISGQIRYFLIFGFISGLQDYGTQVVMTDGGPAGATTVPGFYMFRQMDSYGNYGKASAVGVILFVIIGVCTIFLNKFVKFGDSKDD